jgi:hypothetical protein
MTISDDNRRRFEQIGRERLASALGTGTLQSLGITENHKAEAIEWVEEQDAKRATARDLEVFRQQQTLRWTKIAVGVGIVAILVAIWLARHG